MSKDVISLSISVLLLFRHYISHKITFGAPSSGGVLCSACGAFIQTLHNDCSHIEDMYPLFCAHFMNIFSFFRDVELRHFSVQKSLDGAWFV